MSLFHLQFLYAFSGGWRDIREEVGKFPRERERARQNRWMGKYTVETQMDKLDKVDKDKLDKVDKDKVATERESQAEQVDG